MPKTARIADNIFTRAEFRPSTANAEKRTVDLAWTTGSSVKRYDWDNGEYFLEELVVDDSSTRLNRLNSGAPVLTDHRNSVSNQVGVVERAWIEDGTGYATIRLSDRDDVASLFADIANGIIRNISVGYKVNRYEITRNDGQLPVYRATDWEPMELSLVAVPADPSAQIRADESKFQIVQLSGDTIMPRETESVETRSEEAVADSVNSNDTAERANAAPDLAKEAAKAVAAERKRVKEIRAWGVRTHESAEMIERYIDEGISADTAKAKMLDRFAGEQDKQHQRADVSFTVTEDELDKHRNAAADALLGRAGLLTFDERSQRLQGNPYVNHSALRIARDCALRAGVNVNAISDEEIVQRAFSQSSSDFPVILENTMHKSLMAGYAKASDTWRRFCATGSVSDFRLWKRLKTGTIGNLDSLNENGEFTNKVIPDGEAESVQTSTKGNIINITRHAIINDDLAYFVRLANELARAAARTIESSVYSTLVSNPTMSDGVALFHADHGNLAGAGAAPSVATIDAGRQAMAQQMDISGNDYLDIRPAIAVVPVSLGGEFRVLNAAEYDMDKSPGSTTGKNIMTPNRVRGLLQDIVDSPRLSGNAWYLVADPSEAPSLEVVFLNGNTAPYIESQMGFEVDGVRYKVRLDFGVGVVDYRGAYKNAGA